MTIFTLAAPLERAVVFLATVISEISVISEYIHTLRYRLKAHVVQTGTPCVISVPKDGCKSLTVWRRAFPAWKPNTPGLPHPN